MSRDFCADKHLLICNPLRSSFPRPVLSCHDSVVQGHLEALRASLAAVRLVMETTDSAYTGVP